MDLAFLLLIAVEKLESKEMTNKRKTEKPEEWT